MNIKIIGAITAGTVMALVSGLLIWHKSGKTECVYTIDGRNGISLIENGEAFIKRNCKMKWRKTSNSREEMPDGP